MTAKNTDKVPVTDVLIIALHEDWIASKDKTFQRRHLAAAINASPELTALIAENERMREALKEFYKYKNAACESKNECTDDCQGCSLGDAIDVANQALGE